MNIETIQAADSSLSQRWAIETRSIRFRWQAQQQALAFPDIQLLQGQHLFLRGPSGTGKSTLLGLLSGLQTPAQGQVMMLDQELSTMRAAKRDRFRADHIGVIFQQFNLVPYLSAINNVLLPCKLSKLRASRSQPDALQTARQLLNTLRIPENHWHRNVTTLSIGQQQRVAAARALIGAPEIILADEPTSALDTENRDHFLELLLTLAERGNSSVVFVSHDQTLAKHFHHQLALEASL